MGSKPPSLPARAPLGPNIVVVQTDDQDVASLSPRTMPFVSRLLQANGTTFTDHIASTPLCCPARAVMLTGQYGRNNGVLWNNPGYPDLRQKGNTLPVWLQRAGYRTAHIGKYLNGLRVRPPGPWCRSSGVAGIALGRRAGSLLRLPAAGQRRPRRAPLAARDHLTRVINARARRLVERLAPRHQPFFLSVTISRRTGRACAAGGARGTPSAISP